MLGRLEKLVSACQMNGIIGAFGNGIQKPVYLLFLGWGFRGVVVGHLATDSLKLINVFGHVRAMDMA